MKITLYYSPGACSLAPHIVLEELGIPYEAVRISTADGPAALAGVPEDQPARSRADPRGRRQGAGGERRHPLVPRWRLPSKGLWPATTWDQAQALSLMAWLADTVHPAFAHLFRPERYVEGTACVEAVKAGGRKSFGDSLRGNRPPARREAVGHRQSLLGGRRLPAGLLPLGEPQRLPGEGPQALHRRSPSASSRGRR